MTVENRSRQKSKAAQKPTKRPKQLDIEQFKYLDQLGLPFPQLVLGIKVPQDAFNEEYGWREIRFKPGRRWVKIAHQTCGVFCRQHYYIGTILTPSERLKTNLHLFHWPLPEGLDGLTKYRENLQVALQADCNDCYKNLEEAHYPIDVKFATKLAIDAPPCELDELIDWESGLERARGAMGRWNLVVLGNNRS
jgi:hypothetical protein